jgi:uncharacterized membrane protein YdbT with pleckstrin-like domain
MRRKSDLPDAPPPEVVLPVHELPAQRRPYRARLNRRFDVRIVVITLAIVIAVVTTYFLVGYLS